MGQHSDTADHRRGPTVLAGAAVVAALLGVSGLVVWSYGLGHSVRTGDQASFLRVDSLDVFDPNPNLPATQVSTATVTNVGQVAIKIRKIEFTLTPPNTGSGDVAIGGPSGSSSSSSAPPATVPFDIFPGENCTGALIQPNDYCAVSVRYNNPGQAFRGSLIVTADQDGSTAVGPTGTGAGAGQQGLDSILADPYVVDFGTRKVGTTSPTQTVTMTAAPSFNDYQVVGVSIVDTVPTPGDKADYQVTSDGCTGVILHTSVVINGINRDGVAGPNATAPPPTAFNCPIAITDTPGAGGPRPAFLSVAYCNPPSTTTTTSNPPTTTSNPIPIPVPAAVAAPGAVAPPSSSSSSAPPPPPPPNTVFCPNTEGQEAFHQLVSLTGAGAIDRTTPPPTTTTTTTTTPPPPTTTVTTPPPTFSPVLTAVPPLAPAGRTTNVSGTGFPKNTGVTFALVPMGTPTTINVSNVPGFATVTTDGNGAFANQIMVLLPHTPPGEYEILATSLFGRTTVAATLNFRITPGTLQPPKFVNRH